jgi:hypothetical protein
MELYALQSPCFFLSLAEDNIGWDRVREDNRRCGKFVAVFLVILAVVDGIFDQLRSLTL